MYYTVIKHDGQLRTRGKCREHEPQASVFYISRVFSNVRSVLSRCNTRIRLLHLLYDRYIFYARKTIKRVSYSDKTWVFDQSECAQGPIYLINQNNKICQIHFEITGYPCDVIGSQWCDLLTNCTIFCSKSHLFLSQWEWDSKTKQPIRF